MSETQAVERVRRRRSQGEAERLVLDYERSGMTRVTFCRQHGLSSATLDNYRKRYRPGVGAGSMVPLVAVDLVERVPVAHGWSGDARLFVELAGGRRIGVTAGFDAATLRQLLGVLGQG